MEYLQQKLQLVIHYMNNMNEFAPNFWENLKATKLQDKTEDYINDIDILIEEWIDNGKVAFYSKYKL
jgi:hypothetical protein